MDMITIRFGELLANKRAREQRRISILQVSEETGITRQALKAMELNKLKRIDLADMDKLCKYFGVFPSDLFEYRDTNPADSEKTKDAAPA